MSKILRKIEKYLKESEIDWDAVRDAAITVAEKIHGEADLEVINDMIETIRGKGKAKDTEEAIGIIKGMLRSS